MRVKLSRSQTYIPEFNDNRQLPEGEQIKAVLSPVELGDFLDLTEYFQQISDGQTQVDTSKLSVSKMKNLLRDGGKLLPKYVVLKGLLNDETGDEISVNDVSVLPSFIPLAAELLVQLAAVSAPSEADVKN